jgi:LAO/AO transport system kinase
MEKRRAQQVRWMWTLIEERFRERLRTDPKVKARLPALEAAVADGKLPPALAAEEIADLLGL